MNGGRKKWAALDCLEGHPLLPIRSAAMKASCGMLTLPILRSVMPRTCRVPCIALRQRPTLTVLMHPARS
jgi:hypothetical protein